MEVVPLQFAVAQELAATLNQVLGERDRDAAPAATVKTSTRVVADPRTNLLIVRASRESLPHILELIRRLDREIE
jgi:type II secretory pathway component GspD/PulD (secretin)